ncbi:hypothetical protein KGM_200436 [Danaus plexippus plexippus]|uniref:Uncharacterized protein n=1 Tax=Danaus plexippus plexippus TaxID=278856 RepID=A0A212EXW8_DANPL|nr:hypothetical protein KGM_200436 [Danaus plexippus plexippus]
MVERAERITLSLSFIPTAHLYQQPHFHCAGSVSEGAVCGRRASCTYADPAGWLYAACHASGRRDTAFTCSIHRGESDFHEGNDNDRAVSTSGRSATVTAVLNVSELYDYNPRSL